MKLWRIFIFAFASMSFAQTRDTEFAKLADRYFDETLFKYDPAQATSAGFHQYDRALPTFSRAEIQSNVADLKKFEAAVEKFGAGGLSASAGADRELVLSQIRGQILSLENIRGWEKNPDNYSSYATNAIFVIMARTFAPPEDRLRSAIARERQIPRLLQSARENLSNPAAYLRRYRHRATSRRGELFPERRALGVSRCHRQAIVGGVQERERCRDRFVEFVSDLLEDHDAAARWRRFPDRRG